MKKQISEKRRFSHAQIRYILESTLTDRAIAKELNVVHGVIGSIRNGKTYGELFPELPRRAKQRCAVCIHWMNSNCSFGFPEPKREGHLFAAFCNYFEEDKALSRSDSSLNPKSLASQG